MQSQKITQLAIDALKSGKYNQVRINFPNPDMVGHTGDLDATVEACTTVDACVKVRLWLHQPFEAHGTGAGLVRSGAAWLWRVLCLRPPVSEHLLRLLRCCLHLRACHGMVAATGPWEIML